jgi:hypothetical protein
MVLVLQMGRGEEWQHDWRKAVLMYLPMCRARCGTGKCESRVKMKYCRLLMK